MTARFFPVVLTLWGIGISTTFALPSKPDLIAVASVSALYQSKASSAFPLSPFLKSFIMAVVDNENVSIDPIAIPGLSAPSTLTHSIIGKVKILLHNAHFPRKKIVYIAPKQSPPMYRY